MAITIEQNPNELFPAHNSMIYVLNSTNVAQDNFKYVNDIIVNGAADPIRTRFPADPRSGSGIRGLSDVHRIIRDSVLPGDIDLTTSAFVQCANMIMEYQCKFGEEYG